MVDPDKLVVWLEKDGQVLQRDYLGLAGDMLWVLHYVDEQTRQKLSEKMGFKLRVPYRRRRALPEAVRLVGRDRSGELVVRVSVDKLKFDTATFKNVSLVRGADAGFAIDGEK